MDDFKLLKEDMLAFIDPGVAEDDIEHTVKVEHHNFIRWFDVLDRISAQQREPVVRVKELEWVDTGQRGFLQKHYYAVSGCLRHTVHPLASEDGGFVEHYSIEERYGEPEPWKLVYWVGNSGLAGINASFSTFDAAKSAAQADYEQRIRAAIEIAPQSDRQPSPGQKQVSETGKELLKNTEQPMNNAAVSVGELAGFFATEFPHLLTMLTQFEVARALLARFRIERLDRLASSGRR